MIGMANKPQLEALTGLRFVAAIVVVAFHLNMDKFAGVPQPLQNLIRNGDLGATCRSF